MFTQMMSGFKVRVVLLVRMAGVLRVVRVMAILVGLRVPERFVQRTNCSTTKIRPPLGPLHLPVNFGIL